MEDTKFSAMRKVSQIVCTEIRSQIQREILLKIVWGFILIPNEAEEPLKIRDDNIVLSCRILYYLKLIRISYIRQEINVSEILEFS